MLRQFIRSFSATGVASTMPVISEKRILHISQYVLPMLKDAIDCIESYVGTKGMMKTIDARSDAMITHYFNKAHPLVQEYRQFMADLDARPAGSSEVPDLVIKYRAYFPGLLQRYDWAYKRSYNLVELLKEERAEAEEAKKRTLA